MNKQLFTAAALAFALVGALAPSAHASKQIAPSVAPAEHGQAGAVAAPVGAGEHRAPAAHGAPGDAGEHGAAAAHGAHGGQQADGEHWSVIKEYVPEALMSNLRGLFGPSWIEGNEHIHLSHIFLAVLVFLFGIGLALSARRKLKHESDYLVPHATWSAFTFFDVLIELVLGLMESMMPRDKAMRFLPLVTSFALFILISNVMGLIPGLLPPTDSLNTTLALAVVAFVAYNYWGIQAVGVVAHFKHMMGPIWWIAPLIFVIELIGHFARILSLSMRLMGNMFGDHMVLSIFLGFNLLLVPLPLIALGLVVCVVQTLVFTLLTIVYIAMAIEQHDDHHEHAEAH